MTSVGRNDTCPCGSGRKYKRCHGAASANGYEVRTLSELIADSHSNAAAKAFEKFEPSAHDLRLLRDTGIEMLQNFPVMPAACATMSAMCAARFQMNSEAPIYVAAGELWIRDRRCFGDRAPATAETFNHSRVNWDGHCWLVFGNYIADVSIFRTAYSGFGPPGLRDFALQQFGAGKGLLIATCERAATDGLKYYPQYVLTEGQITGLIGGAKQFFDGPHQP